MLGFSLVMQTGDNGDGDLPAFALSRRPEQESVSESDTRRS